MKNQCQQIDLTFCKQDVPEYNLECKACYNVISFCIASGKHVVLGNLSKCPNCDFPCNIKEMKELLVNEIELQCVMER